MNKGEVLDLILASKVIAVIRMSDAGRLTRVVEAVGRGGVRAIEITMTTPSAVDIIAHLAAKKPAGTLIGAGTVLDATAAERVIRAGAQFIVSPITDSAVIDVCRKNDVLAAPGALSPTEIMAAWNRGADIVKVFPATLLGPKYFQDLRGPLPQVRLMPTGGVSIENAREFIRGGACCVAVGSALLDPKAIEAEDWDVLTKKARALVGSLA
jgi:2-dehydro-3-deoxyphosphogluconate aldolase/(4S)-4-hydroxy-2-oxoglutarate aldolase